MSAVTSQPGTSVGTSSGESGKHECTWCGLPVAVTAASGSPISPLYCCYGCRFAHSVVQEQGEEGAIRWTVIRLGLAIFFTMNLMAFTMTMWSLDVYDVEPDPFQQKLYEMFRWLSMLLALPVLLLLGIPLLRNAIETWRMRVLSTDLLIGGAVFAAYAMSATSVVRGDGALYFEVGAMVLVMMTLGRWIEATGRHKATESLDQLLTLLPETVSRVSHQGGYREEETVPVVEVQINDELRVRAGERFATDGVLTLGKTSVDQQTFTGESSPVPREAGDAVLAGTVNLDGDIVVRVTSLFREGSFGRLLETLQQARSDRGQYQRLAEEVASWFVPVVALLAVAAFVWHMSAGISVAIQVSMSVLLIACPCALGLATPLAVWTAFSVGIRRQVLFRSGEALERLASVDAICIDKTGTLTTGVPEVCSVVPFDCDRDEIPWQTIGELAQASQHPFAQAVGTWIATSTVDASTQETTLQRGSIKTLSGKGIEAETIDQTNVRMGSVSFACEKHPLQVSAINPTESVALQSAASLHSRNDVTTVAGDLDGTTANAVEWLDRLYCEAGRLNASLTVVSSDGLPVAGFLISESLREEARQALGELARIASPVHVLSGDRTNRAIALHYELGIPDLTVEGDLKPHDKVDRVRQVRSHYGTTVMVGDGINDAPALAASDVGIAMGCGADVSRDSADICLLSNDLRRIPWSMELAQRTRSIIRQNLCWAFGYNSIGVGIAVMGWLNPAFAAALMITSSLLVISNSLRLLQESAVAEQAVAELQS